MNTKSFWLKWIDLLFPYLLLLIAILGLSFTLLIQRTDLTIYSLYVVIPMVLGAFILIINRNAKLGDLAFPIHLNKINFSNLFLLNILIFVITIIILFSSETRPLAYFILISLYAGLIFLQVLSQRSKWTNNLILLEIILLSLNLIWGVTLKYPLYFLDGDTFNHMNIISSIVQTAHTEDFIQDTYIFYPLYHIFNAIGIEITGMSVRTALFVLMGLAWQVGIIFAFLLFKRLSGSIRFALIACLLFAVSSEVIFYASYAIARSLAFVFMMCWLYLILCKAEKDTRYLFLSLIAMIVMIMTHHLNILIVIPLLILMYLVQLVFIRRTEPHRMINPLFVYLTSISCIVYLLWVSSELSNSYLPGALRDLGQMEYGFRTGLSGGYGYSVILGIINYSFVVLLSILGISIVFKYLRSTGKQLIAGIFALIGFIMLIVYIPGPIDLLQFADIVLTARLHLMATPLVIFLMAYGIYYLLNIKSASAKSSSSLVYSCIVPVLLVIGLTFFGAISTGNAQDNDNFPHTMKIDTPYHTNSELAAYSYLNNEGDLTLTLYTDYQTYRNTFPLTNFESRDILGGGDISYIQDGYLLLRIGELERKTALTFWLTLADRETEYRYSIDPLDDESNILINLEPEDRIYDNDYVQIFKLSNYLAIPQTVPVTSYHLGE